MSYKVLIDRECRRAFTLLKDLRKSVVVNKASKGSFDFATSEMAVTPSTVNAQILFTSGTKLSTSSPKAVTAILLVAEVGEVGISDEIVDGADTWVVKAIPMSGMFTLQIELERKQNG